MLGGAVKVGAPRGGVDREYVRGGRRAGSVGVRMANGLPLAGNEGCLASGC